jgi:hypothetical protein
MVLLSIFIIENFNTFSSNVFQIEYFQRTIGIREHGKKNICLRISQLEDLVLEFHADLAKSW